MSASVFTFAYARRVGHDFVALLHGMPMDQLLPGSTHNQLVVNKLIHDTLAEAGDLNIADELACARLQRFCQIVLALFDEGRLLSTAPPRVRGAFIDALEIAGQATNLKSRGMLQ